MNQPIDYKQRLAALNPLRSVCVTAPAGSGKTELLSQRVLKLLARVNRPEEILAITFTRKAAAEMHHRIIQALRNARDFSLPEAAHKRLTWQLAQDVLIRDQQHSWNLLENTNRLKVQTIDSFCASLTRQMPILSNFGSQPQITDNPQRCYRIAVRNFLQQLEQDGPFAYDLVRLLAHLDNDMAKAERLLIVLLQRRDQWLLHIGMGNSPERAKSLLENTLKQLIFDVLSQLKKQISPYAADLLPLLDYAGCHLQWQKTESIITRLAGIIELPAIDLDAFDQWLAIAEILLTQGNTLRKTVDKRLGFATETHDGNQVLAKELKQKFISILELMADDMPLQQLLLDLRYLPAPHYDQQQWQLLESLNRLLPFLLAELALVFQQLGEVDYSQISMAALQALGEGIKPTELAMKLDYQLHHILVDEFQDTASTQFRLLERLVEGWAEHNEFYPDNPKTLFIVGDGMQSIYGFREANVGLFLDAKQRGVNGVKLDDLALTVNFRSSEVIVDWVNTTFSQVFPSKENISRGAVPYNYAQAFNTESTNSEVKLFGFSGDNANIQEAEKVLQLVRDSQKQKPDGSIAILVRNRSHLREIIGALTAANMRWTATDIDPLASYSVIIDLMSLTRALLNIADTISWVALLRSPWVGMDNSDLFSLLSKNQQRSIFSALTDEINFSNLENHKKFRLAQVTKIFNTAYVNRDRLSARSWVEGIWMDLGGSSTIKNNNELDYIDTFFDLLEDNQHRNNVIDLKQLEDSVNKLYAAASTISNKLYVMTIHKAKGLEFDTVIMPALSRSSRADEKSLLMWREHMPTTSRVAGLIISPLAATGNEEDKIYQHLRFEQAESTKLENIRLFYVGATRAITNLYILVTSEMDLKTTEMKCPAKNSLLFPAWSVLNNHVSWTIPLENHNKQCGLDEQNADHLLRIKPDWKKPFLKYTNPLKSFYLEINHEVDNNIPDKDMDNISRCVGLVTHWIFEQLCIKGIDFWHKMKIETRDQWLEQLLHYHSLPSVWYLQAIKEVVFAVQNTLSDHRGQWILSNEHKQTESELCLLSSLESVVKRKTIDRIFVDNNDVLWIIDFKTSKPMMYESKDEFLNRSNIRYKPQLLDYKVQLLNKLNNTSGKNPINFNYSAIKTALYYTFYPHWQELDL